jgi:hypothetical protein
MADPEYVVARTTASGLEIRHLADAGIQASINKVLADLPAGKKGAIVLYADGDEVRGGIYGKLGRSWSYAGTLSRRWDTGAIGAEAAVAFTW